MTQIISQVFCTADEIRTITGRQRVSAQRRWLDQHGWTYAVSASGNIIIAATQREARLNPVSVINEGNIGQDAPNWSALDAK